MRVSHSINLFLGGAALISFRFIADPDWLLLSMVGIGFAWASIVSLPYALLSDSVPAQKMGLYMGIFNFFIVIPQLVAASVLGFLLKALFGGAPIYALVLGGLSFFLAGLFVLRVPQPAPASARDARSSERCRLRTSDARRAAWAACDVPRARREWTAAACRRALRRRGACPASRW